LQAVYSLPFWPFNMLSQWALRQVPAQPETNTTGQIFLNNQAYASAIVTATAVRDGTNTSIPVTILNDGNGIFRVQFIPSADGDYTINFQTSGSFQDSHGDFGGTQRSLQISIIGANANQESVAWLFTLIYLLFLLFLCLLVHFLVFTPSPFGGWISNQEGQVKGRGYFKRARRGLRQWFLHRNLIYSQQVNMPHGLRLRFLYGGGIEVQPSGRASKNWQDVSGNPLRPNFRELRELRYHEDSEGEPLTFLILPHPEKRAQDDDDDPRESRQERQETRRRNGKRPAYAEEDEDYGYQRERRSPSQSKKRNSGRRSTQRYEYDDDDD
jgi:hypothetical protein